MSDPQADIARALSRIAAAMEAANEVQRLRQLTAVLAAATTRLETAIRNAQPEETPP
jgi:hypothetical protein